MSIRPKADRAAFVPESGSHVLRSSAHRPLDHEQRSELLAVLLEAVPAGVVQVAADGQILVANSRAVEILGKDIEGLAEESIDDFEARTMRDDGSPCPVADYPVAKVLATGEAQPPMTIGVRRPNGTVSWAVFRAIPTRNAQGELSGAFVTFVDITERKQMEEELRKQERSWRLLAENHPDFVMMVGRDMRIRSVNRVLEQFELEKIIGLDVLAHVHEDHREEWVANFNRAIEQRESVTFETRGTGPGGATVWYESTAVPMVDGTEVASVLLVSRDVTARRAMIASLAERERLASVGMLSASVAHEIMNPLTYVLANLDFAVSDRCPPGARQTKALLDAREGAARMQQIVRDLRSLARAGTQELFYVDVRAVIDTALRLSGPEVAKNVTIDGLPDLPGVLASESRLCQVFINLFVNATQAMAELAENERKIAIAPRALGDMVAVDVTDSGRGIPPEQLGRIFEPFFTTKPTGTGLGLSISKENIERMGGRLEVRSELGHGATFTVWLSTMRAPPRSS